MEIKTLAKCTLDEITEAWNKGFEGYLLPATMDTHSLIKKIVAEELSTDFSIIGAIKMMEALFEIYRKNNVSTATLEALEKNERAIALYKKFGYEVKDYLLFINKQINSNEFPFQINRWSIEAVLPEQLAEIDFYTSHIPWQCQWQSLDNGEAFFVKDQLGGIVGYGLYKKVINADGKVEKVNIYDLNYQPEKISNTEFIKKFISYVAASMENSIELSTFNFPSNNPLAKVLMDTGFEKKIVQVYMEKLM